MMRERLSAGNAAALAVDHRTGLPIGAQDESVPAYIISVNPLAKLAKITTMAIVVIAGILMAPGRAAAGENPAGFIRILGNQGLEVIRSNMTLGEKEAYFRQMLHQDFDLIDLSRFVLGPYWRVASEGQRQEFCSLFEEYLVRFYGERFAQDGGVSLQVTGSRTDPAGAIVTSQIIRPQGPPIEVDWQLGISDGRYKIRDVIIDGVSMAMAQRFAFASMIQRSGGQVAGLLATMRE
jgi:phospholipid transport system substrate-binding protein